MMRINTSLSEMINKPSLSAIVLLLMVVVALLPTPTHQQNTTTTTLGPPKCQRFGTYCGSIFYGQCRIPPCHGDEYIVVTPLGTNPCPGNICKCCANKRNYTRIVGCAPGNAENPILESCDDDRYTINITDHKDRQNSQSSLCYSILRVHYKTDCSNTDLSPKSTPTGCGIRNPKGVGITINGFKQKQAQLGEFPWMVAVLDHATTFVGGGSLVHPRVILTAAHKVHEKVANTLVARIGDWDLSNTDEPIANQNINVERILFHPGFDRWTMENNVALLILETEATLGETVMPICLPEPGVTYGTDCIVTGWGKNVYGEQGRYQRIMKEVHVLSVSHSECQRLLRNTPRLGSNFTLHSTFNCADANGEDDCEVDGGSPLVCPKPNKPNEYVQTGVLAWGIGCGEVGKPGVYGSIPQTVDWITRTIAEQAQPELGFDIRAKPTPSP